MSPVTFAPQGDFMFMHPGVLDVEACKGTPSVSEIRTCEGTDATWPSYPYPLQWLPQQDLQPASMLQAAAWQSSEDSASQIANMSYSSDPSLQSGSVWAPNGIYWQLDAQNAFAYPVEPTASSLRGQIWRLAQDQQGCHLVQQALDEAACDEERVALVTELHTHVQEALRCPNANYVIQKCIGTMSAWQSQFIIDEICGFAARVARHKYGCRILQRLFEHCSAEQMLGIVDELLGEAAELSTHIYGSYVMKHLLEHGAGTHTSMLTQVLANHVSTVCQHSYGCAVLCDALTHTNEEAKVALARALLLRPDVLTYMAHSRHGQAAVKLVLQLGEAALPSERQAALSALRGQRGILATSRYGRAMNKYLNEQGLSREQN